MVQKANRRNILVRDNTSLNTISHNIFEIIHDKNILCKQDYEAEYNSDMCDTYGLMVGASIIVSVTSLIFKGVLCIIGRDPCEHLRNYLHSRDHVRSKGQLLLYADSSTSPLLDLVRWGGWRLDQYEHHSCTLCALWVLGQCGGRIDISANEVPPVVLSQLTQEN